ncbi:MAG TPA: hypothetical protein VNN08_17010 [Thermoanaerobaculia bacterium]|nr:hypothetical protein [Thermoanaerobaculia bacterium]
MDEFRTIARFLPTGAEIDLGTDSNLLGGPSHFTRNATPFATPDGVTNYEFLFWNTGRHVTSKRRVRWNFNVLGWGTWTATRWYGPPGGGPGSDRVRADAFSISGDAPISADTPINGPASTFPPGAWPADGDSHLVSTANGAIDIVAKDPFASLDFAGWLQLIPGGDPSGEFVETDDGTSGSFGSAGYYDHVTAGPFHVAQHGSAYLLATYARSASLATVPVLGLVKAIQDGSLWDFIINIADPAPDDRIRERLLESLREQTRPSLTAKEGDLQHLIENAPSMKPAELKRAAQVVKTTIDLGKVALSTIEGQLNKGGR